MSDFKFEGIKDFQFICKLKAKPLIIKDDKRYNKKIVAFDFHNEKAKEIFENEVGVVYMITAYIDNNEYIIKFGQTRTPFIYRLQSYNCGTVVNWRTASTANIKILQSFVSTRLEFKLYLYQPQKPLHVEYYGEFAFVASPASIFVEDRLLNIYLNQFHQKPIANIQSKMTRKK
ncbi:hypothetical protein ACXYRO_02685 [Mycoplasma sp. 4013]